MSDGFHAGGANSLGRVLLKKFKKAQKSLREKMDSAADHEERCELRTELEQLEKDHQEQLRQIDRSVF